MISAALQAHLDGGATTLARCWAVTRRDGVVLGFTDHDRDLSFDGVTFRADSGLSGSAIEVGTGLAVDNGEVMGALRDAGLSGADLEAGRFDGAPVRMWQVNWRDVTQQTLEFSGTLGDIRRKGSAFEADLRGLTQGLNRPVGRVFQAPCGAVLGDAQCGFDLDDPLYRIDLGVTNITGGRRFRWPILPGFEPGWFTHGRLDVLTGAAHGLWAAIKTDLSVPPGRVIDLWEPIRAPIAAGDQVRLTAGCDKRFDSCAGKFANQANFRGFPDIPSADWLIALPSGQAS
jgi:uncharacterized phage protein (TIGR02218 family)